jgi:hypothetical protein
MRNHAFVENVVSRMFLYNNNEYLIDLDEIITTNQYGTTISNILEQIKNILKNELLNNSSNIKIIKNSLKKYIFQILIFENGDKCCSEIVNL